MNGYSGLYPNQTGLSEYVEMQDLKNKKRSGRKYSEIKEVVTQTKGEMNLRKLGEMEWEGDKVGEKSLFSVITQYELLQTEYSFPSLKQDTMDTMKTWGGVEV